MLRCDSCHYCRYFWSVSGKFGKSSLPVGDSKIRIRNDMVYSSILGGRLVGISLTKLSLYHATLNISPPPNNYIFPRTQRDILIGAEQVAIESMNKAKIELETMYNLPFSNSRVHCVASYDGVYQARSGKSRGSFSRYCFSSAISVDSGKVLSYDIACNSCPRYNEYEHKYTKEHTNEDEYQTWAHNHKTINLSSKISRVCICPIRICSSTGYS